MTEHSHSRPEIPNAEELARLPKDGGEKWNRLVFEKSPYLQQHAANPVDWFPWGPEAFEKARREDKPVFLSVGYSTCHWCHVMERESFEDAEIGALMNDAFVCIKVDREERPDIDHVYMTVTQAMTGSGGWPMTVIMTPEKKPFFSGTYYPRESRYGRPGMAELVPHIKSLWASDRKKLMDTANYIAAELGKLSGGFPGEEINASILRQAWSNFSERFDNVRGGFGSRPKFPVPHNYSFLLRYWEQTGDATALAITEKSLQAMRLGGVFDQVGFGTHRYSTDEVWLVPHFEKMLYDQALLAIANIECHQATGKATYRQTAEEIFSYVLRDMQSREGGFYSAEDADSEGEEGKFYVWSVDEVIEALGEEEGRLFAKVFNFEGAGNFYEESTGQQMGTNIPFLRRDVEGTAKQMNLDPDDVRRRIAAARERLFEIRERRIHPFKDDKILTDWNGLMIAALAKGAMAFNEPGYEDAARQAADFCLSTLRSAEGRLLKRYRHGEAGLPAHVEDYAFLAWGLIELYQANFEAKYLLAASELTEAMVKHFWDAEGHGFFHTADDGEQLLVRSKDVYDGAIPSGNSVAALVLMKLSRMFGRADYEEKARQTMAAFAGQLQRGPDNFSQMLIAADMALHPGSEVILAGDDEAIQAMAREVRARFLPRTVMMKHDPELFALAPELAAKNAQGGKATAYVCRNFACEEPVTTAEALAVKLQNA